MGSSRSKVYVGSESSGFKQATDDVVAEVAKPERSPAEVLEPTVERFCRTIGCARAIEKRQDARGTLLQGPAESADLDQRGGDVAGDAVDHGFHHGRPAILLGLSVCGDDALIDSPRRFDLDVLVSLE